jgi:hypothetical protein
MTTSIPPVPKGTGPGGAKLWRETLSRYCFEEHELRMLREAVRTTDELDALAAVVAAEGVTIGAKVHPALIEARQLRLVLARLIAALRIPNEDDDHSTGGRRPQRRGGPRGIYAVGLGGLANDHA